MLAQNKIMAFAVTANADAARNFYQNTLGLALITEHEFAIVFDAFGIELRLQKAPDHRPLPQTTLGWNVPNIEGNIDELSQKGVEMVRYDWMDQDALGIWQPQPGVKICWFHDPDGNLLSLTQD